MGTGNQKPQVTGEEQPSLSDIDFDPQQHKLMNNFFSQKDQDKSSKKSEHKKSSEGSDPNDQAVIIGEESKNDDGKQDETDLKSFCGDLAQ